MIKKRENDLAINRQAFHNYEILETLEAGIVLTGTEIKSLKDGGGNISEAYVIINSKNEVFLKNSSISPYAFGNIHNHIEKRERKLLLHAYEIDKLKRSIRIKGCTIIALSIYLKKRFAKVKLGIAKGKKLYDKRQDIKKREQKRKIDSALKEYS